MPRELFFRRRLMADRAGFHSANTPSTSSAVPKDTLSFEEDRAMSDHSSDSGRESTAPGDLALLSPSVSFDASRPCHLSIGQGSITSSTSSDSLPAKSPLSPMGHISSLPRILQNLAVSGNQQEITDIHQLSFTQHAQTSSRERQLAQPPCYVDARQSGGQSLLTVQLYPPLPPASSFLSPSSRKRSNSITSAADNATPNAITSMAAGRPASKQKRTKGGRQVAPDKLTSSPVKGTIIREVSETPGDNVIVVRRGDVDRSINVVDITEEKRAAIAKIENTIGDYICRLCKVKYEDVFALAGHNCPQIVHLEYQCPECGKSFHCPANLASHRRWHKPKVLTKLSSQDEQLNSGIATPRLALHPEDRKLESDVANKRSSLSRNAEDTVSDVPSTLSEKPTKFNIPFKKRFFFRKHNEKNVDEVQTVSLTADNLVKECAKRERTPKSVEKEANITVNNCPSSYEKLLQERAAASETQHYRCTLCGMQLQGAQNYAQHWQGCLSAAVCRNWSSLLCKTPK